MEQVKLLSMTLVLTVLIWAIADTLVSETASVQIRVELTPLDGDMIVEQQTDVPVTVDVSGPRQAVDAVRAKTPISVTVPVGNLPQGISDFNMDPDQLERAISDQLHDFRQLSITEITPNSLVVNIDRRISKPAKITTRQLTVSYDAPPQLAASAAQVTLRQSVFEQLTADGRVLAVDVSDAIDRFFRDRPQGQRITAHIRLVEPTFGRDAEFVPREIDVTAIVKDQEIIAEIGSVPVLLAVSFKNFEKPFRPVRPDGTPLEIVNPTITVKGPPEAVAGLQRGETRAYGIIRLKEDDLETLETPGAFQPIYHLPPNVSLVSVPENVEFRLLNTSSEPESP